MPADKPTELSRMKLKNLNSIARPYDQQAFSPPDPTAIWHSHLALAIYIFVVVNFDALAQASEFRIERRQVVFLYWMQDSNLEGLWNPIFSRLNACWQTDWAIEDEPKKIILDSPSLWSASIPCFLYIHIQWIYIKWILYTYTYPCTHTYTHTHTHIYIYIYISVYTPLVRGLFVTTCNLGYVSVFYLIDPTITHIFRKGNLRGKCPKYIFSAKWDFLGEIIKTNFSIIGSGNDLAPNRRQVTSKSMVAYYTDVFNTSSNGKYHLISYWIHNAVTNTHTYNIHIYI